MSHKGFTLIEFIVILSIFAIMAGVALVNFAGFRSNVGLNNLAHDIALTIRQAQVFGWASQSENNSSSVIQLDPLTHNPVRFADGVYFNYDNGAFADNFILYSKNDSTVTHEYYTTNPLPDIIRDTIKIQGPNHISAIVSGASKSDLILPNHEIPTTGRISGSVSIAFSRPHPEALFFQDMQSITDGFIGIYISADSDCPNTQCNTAEHVITVSRFGEIAVQ
jgi:prepilin-type N-terminal cleavage/methylation domain-containing protein